jgi:tight adherence protein B
MIISRWTLVGWFAALLIAAGVGLAIYTIVTDKEGVPYKAFMAYAEDLERLVRLMYMPTTGVKIAQQQLAAAVGSAVLAFLMGETILLLFTVGAVILPKIMLEDKLAKRRKSIDDVLDSFLVALANALKVSPSLGDALRSTAILIRGPIKEDVEYALKEYNLGTPLDQALMNMATRIDSRTFSSAMATLLIGRQTGGDLPKILERSAATLREMARLEGVVRTQDRRGQEPGVGARGDAIRDDHRLAGDGSDVAQAAVDDLRRLSRALGRGHPVDDRDRRGAQDPQRGHLRDRGEDDVQLDLRNQDPLDGPAPRRGSGSSPSRSRCSSRCRG